MMDWYFTQPFRMRTSKFGMLAQSGISTRLFEWLRLMTFKCLRTYNITNYLYGWFFFFFTNLEDQYKDYWWNNNNNTLFSFQSCWMLLFCKSSSTRLFAWKFVGKDLKGYLQKWKYFNSEEDSSKSMGRSTLK